MINVFVVAQDAGGASALCPVIEFIHEEPWIKVHVYSCGSASVIFRRNKIVSCEIAENFNEADACKLLLFHRCKGILLGTAISPDSKDKLFLAAAKSYGIFTLSIVDYWSNYSARFSARQNDFCYLPNMIAVIDDTAMKEAINEGIEAKRIYVTGQPAFDKLEYLKKKITENMRHEIRSHLGVSDNEIMILFASQPILETCIKQYGNANHIGYNEFIVLKALFETIEDLEKDIKKKFYLVVRPHPSENKEKYLSILNDRSSVRGIVTHWGVGCEVALSSDLVVGMDSEFLVETAYMGCPTISFQPNLKNIRDSVQTNRNGLSRPVYRIDEMGTAIMEMLSGERKSQNDSLLSNISKYGGGAAKRIALLFFNGLLNLNTEIQ